MALVTVLASFVLISPLLALVVRDVTAGLLLRARAPAEVQTFHTAEAGLAWARAQLRRSVWFEKLVAAGPADGRSSGLAAFPARVSPPSFFPRSPYRFRLDVRVSSGDRAEILSSGMGPPGMAVTLALSVRKSLAPFVPAPLLTPLPPGSVYVDPRIRIHGPAGEGPAFLPGCCGDDAGPVAAVDFPPASELAGRAQNRSGIIPLPPQASGALGTGIFVREGSLRVTDLTIGGILVVRGALHVEKGLTMRGLLIALGDVWLADGATLHLEGVLIQGAEADYMRLGGSGEVALGWQAIDLVERIAPGLLPRAAVVAGWKTEGIWDSS